MKYISYLIFFAFIAALLFFLKNALEPKQVPVHITDSLYLIRKENALSAIQQNI